MKTMEEFWEACRKLAGLMQDEHPGLLMWNQAVYDQVKIIAETYNEREKNE
jgi:hypothetical protein